MLLTDSKRTSSFMRKTLVLIPSKQEFDKITEDPQQVSPPLSKHTDSQPSHHQKPLSEQDIVVPRNGILPQQLKISYPPKFPKPIQNHGYFRLRSSHNLPNPQRYNLTQSDTQFIRHLKKQYNFNKKYKFQSKTFIAIIQNLQLNFHKLKTISLEWENQNYLQYLNFTIPIDIATKINAKEKDLVKRMTLQIIDYWKKEKVLRGSFPLVRIYWPKTDIAISKYSFWVPFKTRIIQETNKKIVPVKVMKNFGNTQKQRTLNKQAKDANIFLTEVKDIADTQLSQHLRFKKDVSQFHKLAQNYGFEVPQNFGDLMEKRSNPEYMKILEKLDKSAYFSNPIVKLTSRSRFLYRPMVEKCYEVVYDGETKILDIKTSENSMDQYKIDVLEPQNIWLESNKQNYISKIKARKVRAYNLYGEKKTNGYKRVKVE